MQKRAVGMIENGLREVAMTGYSAGEHEKNPT
jgi:hypothetical protein